MKNQVKEIITPVHWTKQTQIAIAVKIICANWKSLKHLSVDPGSRINSSSVT